MDTHQQPCHQVTLPLFATEETPPPTPTASGTLTPPVSSAYSLRIPRSRLLSAIPFSVHCKRCGHFVIGDHLLHCSLAPHHSICTTCAASALRTPHRPPSDDPSCLHVEPLQCPAVGCDGHLHSPTLPPSHVDSLLDLTIRCVNDVFGCTAASALSALTAHQLSCPFAVGEEAELKALFPSLSDLPPSTFLTPLLRVLSILPRCGLTLIRPLPTSFTFTRLLSLIRDSLHSEPSDLIVTSTTTSPYTCTLSFRGLTATATQPRKAQAQDEAASALMGWMYSDVGYRHCFMLPLPGVEGANRKSAVVNLLRGHSKGGGAGVEYEYQRVVKEGEEWEGSGCVVRYQGWGVGWGVGGKRREACEVASRHVLRQLHEASALITRYGEALESDLWRWWKQRERLGDIDTADK